MKPKPHSFQGDDIEWAEVFCRLTLFAFERLGPAAAWARAEQIASHAISAFLAAEAVPPQIADLNLARHLAELVEGLVHEALSEPLSGPEPVLRASADRDGGTLHPRSGASEFRDPISALAKQVAGDRIMEGVVLLSLDGILDASAQAAFLVVPIIEVYEARKRLLRITARIRTENKRSRDEESSK